MQQPLLNSDDDDNISSSGSGALDADPSAPPPQRDPRGPNADGDDDPDRRHRPTSESPFDGHATPSPDEVAAAEEARDKTVPLKKRLTESIHWGRNASVAVDVELNPMKDLGSSDSSSGSDVNSQMVKTFFKNWGKFLIHHDYTPGLKWLRMYPANIGEWLFVDIIAGVSVTVMLIPMVLAYALIAHVPLQNGLYSAYMGLFVYAILGGSRVATVGPVALISLLVFSQAANHGDISDPSVVADRASAMGFYVGIISLVFYFLRVGAVVNFICKPALDGFVTGASLTIAMSQATNFTGIPDASGDNVINLFTKVLPHLNKLQWDVVVGVCSIVFLKLLELLTQPRFKGSLWRYIGLARNFIMIVVATLICTYVPNIKRQLEVPIPVGNGKPHGLVGEFSGNLGGAFKVPDVSIIGDVFAGALVIALVANLQHWSIVKPLSTWEGIESKVDGNQEAFALGVINLLNSFVQGFPICACFTRTVVNVASGCRTMWSGVIAGGLILISIQYLDSTLAHVPLASLAAIILTAVTGLFRYQEFMKLWRERNWGNMFTFIVCFFVTALVGAVEGIGAGVGASILVVILRQIFPRTVVKHLPHKGYGLLLLQGDVSFLTGPLITDKLESINEQFEKDGSLHNLIIHLEKVTYLDVDAAKAISEGLKLIYAQHDSLYVTYVGCSPAVRRRIEAEHFKDIECSFVDTFQDAFDYMPRVLAGNGGMNGFNKKSDFRSGSAGLHKVSIVKGSPDNRASFVSSTRGSHLATGNDDDARQRRARLDTVGSTQGTHQDALDIAADSHCAPSK